MCFNHEQLGTTAINHTEETKIKYVSTRYF